MHYTFLATEVADDLITEGGDYIILEVSGEILHGNVVMSRALDGDIVITETVAQEVA